MFFIHRKYEGRSVVTDEEKLEKVARELCCAAGEDPDATIRLGQPLSFAAGECTVVKPLFVPAWRQYSREARRLAMSDVEHAEYGVSDAGLKRFRRMRRSARIITIKLRRRAKRLWLAAGLRALCGTIQNGATARITETGTL
ncbi:MAG: hypothetical protein JOZ16_05825 [Methylobacteriaceae bacterium]|nr:hypothetical protein [Methylobacteriaceae bacterium]